MGQVFSLERCPYHSLRTKHPEEGYCSFCNKRFSSLRGCAIPDEEDIEESKRHHELDSERTDSCDEEISEEFYTDDKAIRGLFGEKSPAELDEVAKFVDIGRIEDARYNKNVDMHNMTWNRSHPHNIERNLRIFTSQDCIYRCFYCTRFFYSRGELLQHLNASGDSGSGYRNHASHRGEATADANGFCGICERSYTCSVLDHLDSALLHIQRPGLPWKDIQLERMCDCCVRCGIYFTSGEQQRKHFIDIEYHILHVQVELDKQADLQDGYGGFGDLEYPSAHLFPAPPSTLPIPAQSSKTTPVLKPTSSAVVLNSSYAPELRVVPASSRLRYSQASSSLGARPNPGIPIVTVEEQFECPLCLENETDIASLPCGHVYGAECIRKTIASDPRCPLCRRAAEIRNIRRVWPETKPAGMA